MKKQQQKNKLLMLLQKVPTCSQFFNSTIINAIYGRVRGISALNNNREAMVE